MLSKRQRKAADNFTSGYNCAQSVAVAFAEDINMSDEEVLKATSAFGGGFARSRGLCGSVASMGFVAGCLTYDMKDPKAKEHIYTLVTKMMNEFKEEFNTATCGELLKNIKIYNKGTVPDERNEEYYKARPCLMFVLKAVEILEKNLFNEDK